MNCSRNSDSPPLRIRVYLQGDYSNAVEYYNKAADSLETEDKERLELSKTYQLINIIGFF